MQWWQSNGNNHAEQHNEQAAKTIEPNSESLNAGTQASSADVLCFKGTPYSDIVQQLLTNIGSHGGAVQGERNTVYFSLANYMRYICDFDAALLLQVLPDFALSVEERK